MCLFFLQCKYWYFISIVQVKSISSTTAAKAPREKHTKVKQYSKKTCGLFVSVSDNSLVPIKTNEIVIYFTENKGLTLRFTLMS